MEVKTFEFPLHTHGRSVIKIWGRKEGQNINGWLQNAKQHGAITNCPPIKFAVKFNFFCNLQPRIVKLKPGE